MMALTDPWKAFGYSAMECLDKIASQEFKLVAILERKVIGFIAYSKKGIGSSSAISLLCVDASVRRRGIGSLLMLAAEKNVFSYDCNCLLFVSDFNTEAVQFYEKLGYKEVGKLTDYNFIGKAELLMRKTIGPRRQQYAASD